MAQRPAGLFRDRYALLRERASGGQALVQFARGADGGFFQYAIKFFYRVADFELEASFYQHPQLRQTLPPLHGGSRNDGGALRGPSGRPFPPFLVLERGVSLQEWLQEYRAGPAVANMFFDVATQLVRLHRDGHVHRDLKPGNILLMVNSQAWKLIDFGISNESGMEASAKCSIAYAAPEVVQAFCARRDVRVDPAQDIWALGVIVYEAVSGVAPFGRVPALEDVRAAARDDTPYLWETRSGLPAAFARSRMRSVVLQCLQRDPAQRPTAEQLLRAVDRIGNTTYTPEGIDSVSSPVARMTGDLERAERDFAHSRYLIDNVTSTIEA